jgi:hypothetical protein
MGVGESTSEKAYILEVLGEASRVVQEIPVSGYLRIGRGSEEVKPDVLIPPECTSASRQHATLDLRGNRPVLEDQSRYGTFVNGNRVGHAATELSDREEIIFGLPGDGWRVRFRFVDQTEVTTPADLLELLAISENPRQVRMGPKVIEENLGRDAFLLLKFLSENEGRWYPIDRLVDMLWPDPDKIPIAAKSALARSKRRINDLLGPYLQGQNAIVSVPFRGYHMKPRLDPPEKSS